ncbi:hypothetical protein DY218_12445 [Streptomyces triticagri]|uniref:Uncharacterized protein n=1 Tax=Streptomyces triticagri TaxID=2293568 RepID=A0A372M694_9ACTN|nr:hypothetical protein DY218_12445 [Streptomyces triticagri]
MGCSGGRPQVVALFCRTGEPGSDRGAIRRTGLGCERGAAWRAAHPPVPGVFRRLQPAARAVPLAALPSGPYCSPCGGPSARSSPGSRARRSGASHCPRTSPHGPAGGRDAAGPCRRAAAQLVRTPSRNGSTAARQPSGRS